MVLQPREREATDALALPAHGLDEYRLVRDQLGDRVLEARIFLAVARVHGPFHAPPVAHVGIERLDAGALERAENLLGHVIADDRNKARAILALEPRAAGVRTERADHRARGAPEDLVQLQGRAGILADREQRLGVAQTLLRLLVQAHDAFVQARVLHGDRHLVG